MVVGIGEILWDIFPEGRRLGGAPANFSFHAQSLGAQGVIVSRVGNDLPGYEILRKLKSARLDPGYISVDSNHPTGQVTVSLDGQGIPSFIIHEQAAWDYLEFTPELEALAQKADAVCYGSLGQRSSVSGETIRQFLKKTMPDCIRVLDINLRHPFIDEDHIRHLLQCSHVLKLNTEELKALSKMLSLEGAESEILASLLRRFPLTLVALTKGELGSRLYAWEEDSIQSGFPVEVVDTVGAGDAFTAALVIGLLKRKPLSRINYTANKIASFVCAHQGAWVEYPKSHSKDFDL